LSFLARIFGEKEDRKALGPLYAAVVAAGRDPAWFRQGQVPDTLDGRFDMIAALLTLVLLRLEADGDSGRRASVVLTERFIDDMDGTVRQMGIGDLMVGKHVGRMMSALGGRLTVFRAAGGGSLQEPVARNVFRDAVPSPEALAFVSGRLERYREALAAAPTQALLAGEMPSS
jgi:cytochrome b pre-mRNA-processing protein 3